MGKFRPCFWAGILSVATLIGCQSLSKRNTQPGGGDVSAIPAATVQQGASLAALTGEDLGMGGGFLIAASPEKIQTHQRQQALAAAQSAEASPARIEQVRDSTTADLNNDGFVTLDEVLALSRAGLSDDEVMTRLQKTGYIFRITPQQERFLSDRRVSEKIVAALHQMGAGSSPAKV